MSTRCTNHIVRFDLNMRVRCILAAWHDTPHHDGLDAWDESGLRVDGTLHLYMPGNNGTQTAQWRSSARHPKPGPHPCRFDCQREFDTAYGRALHERRQHKPNDPMYLGSTA